MAVAFTREEDYESQAADLPDRPVSPHANLVTATGLAAIEAELAAARAAYSAAQAEGGVRPGRGAAGQVGRRGGERERRRGGDRRRALTPAGFRPSGRVSGAGRGAAGQV